jgi:hypothetical protein
MMLFSRVYIGTYKHDTTKYYLKNLSHLRGGFEPGSSVPQAEFVF